MIQFLGWALLTLAMAATLYFGAISNIPRVFMYLMERRSKEQGVPLNSLGYGGVSTAPVTRTYVPIINPDMAMAVGLYDLSGGRVRLHCQIPPWDTYWSVSLYSWNTDNILVVNSRAVPCEAFDLVIVSRNSKYQAQKNERVVVSPSHKGVVMVRLLIRDRQDESEVARVNEVLRKTVMSEDRSQVT